MRGSGTHAQTYHKIVNSFQFAKYFGSLTFKVWFTLGFCLMLTMAALTPKQLGLIKISMNDCVEGLIPMIHGELSLTYGTLL
jgi:hypothetical protein